MVAHLHLPTSSEVVPVSTIYQGKYHKTDTIPYAIMLDTTHQYLINVGSHLLGGSYPGIIYIRKIVLDFLIFYLFFIHYFGSSDGTIWRFILNNH